MNYSKDAAGSWYGRNNQTNEANAGHCYIGNYYAKTYYYASSIQFSFSDNSTKIPLVVTPGSLKFSVRAKGNGENTKYSTTTATIYISNKKAPFDSSATKVNAGTITLKYTQGGGRTEVTLNSAAEEAISNYISNNQSFYIVVSAGVNTLGVVCEKALSVSNTAHVPRLAFTYEYGASTGTISGSPTLGTTTTLTINPISTNYSHQLTWKIGNTQIGTTSVNAGVKTATYTYQANTTCYNCFSTTSTTAAASVILKTLNGDREMGTKTIPFTLNIGSAAKPTINSFTVTASNPTGTISALQSYFVQDKTTPKWSASVQGKAGATIKRLVVSYSGSETKTTNSLSKSETSVSVSNIESAIPQKSGTLKFTLTVTDSRGLTQTTSTSKTVYAYSKPVAHSPDYYRCLENGTRDDTQGIYLVGDMTTSIASINGKNTKTISMTISSQSGSKTFTKTKLAVKDYEVPITGATIKVTVTDGLNQKGESTFSITPATYLLHFKKNAIGFGTMAGDEGTVTFGFTPVLKNPLALEDGGTGSNTQPGAWGRIVAPGGTMTGNLIIGSTSANKTLTTNGSLYLNKSSNPELVFKANNTQRGNCRVYTGSSSGICFQLWQNGNGVNEVFQLPTTSLTSGSSTTYYNILTTKDYPETKFYIMPNEEIAISSIYVMGHVSSSATRIYFSIPFGKSLDKVNAASVTLLSGSLRCRGEYLLDSSDGINLLSAAKGQSVVINKITNTIYIYIDYDKNNSSQDYELGKSNNNWPMQGTISITLKFT